MNRPNFFIVGAAKSGTSALHECLGRHPQIFMTGLKEPNFFCTDLDVPFRVADEEAYLALFASGERYNARGESSVAYLASEAAPSNIRSYSPDARILISLRQPADALASIHAEARRWGGDPHPNVNDAIAEFVRLGQRQQVRGTPYDRLLRYADQVARYLDTFPRERVMVILYEEWAPAPEIGVRSILDFLGVDSSDVPVMRRVHESARYRSHLVQKLMMTPPRWAERAAGTDRGLRWRTAAIRANVDERPLPEVRADLQAAVKEMYREDVRRMESLLERDIGTWWGY